jgi:hypothetical protein
VPDRCRQSKGIGNANDRAQKSKGWDDPHQISKHGVAQIELVEHQIEAESMTLLTLSTESDLRNSMIRRRSRVGNMASGAVLRALM